MSHENLFHFETIILGLAGETIDALTKTKRRRQGLIQGKGYIVHIQKRHDNI